MRLRTLTLAGLILLVLAFTTGSAFADTVNDTAGDAAAAGGEEVGDIEEYQGLIGPEHALYGLRRAFENFDEALTFNASEKLGKKVAHAERRIAEARAMLNKKNDRAAGMALEEYEAEVEDANDTASRLSSNDTGLLHAQKMILKHQIVLLNLSISHPDSKGLQRALNNSRELQRKFEAKTSMKLAQRLTKDGRIVINEERMGGRQAGEGGNERGGRAAEDRGSRGGGGGSGGGKGGK